MRKLRKKKKPNFIKRARARSNGFIIKKPAEIEIMREANQIVARAFDVIEDALKPGISLKELDTLVESYIRSQGAKPLYKGYRGNPPTHPPFPGTICASLNNEICHGLPDQRTVKNGDIIGIDIGLRYKEYCGDSCYTFTVGEVKPAVQKFLTVSEQCLYAGIAAAQPGARLGEIGYAIETLANKNGYTVVREWGGHGIGRDLHEPMSVPHHGPASYGPRLEAGMTFTIEPMINMGKADCKLMPDGWTVETQDGQLSAQYEHTIAITKDGPSILSIRAK